MIIVKHATNYTNLYVSNRRGLQFRWEKRGVAIAWAMGREEKGAGRTGLAIAALQKDMYIRYICLYTSSLHAISVFVPFVLFPTSVSPSPFFFYHAFWTRRVPTQQWHHLISHTRSSSLSSFRPLFYPQQPFIGKCILLLWCSPIRHPAHRRRGRCCRPTRHLSCQSISADWGLTGRSSLSLLVSCFLSLFFFLSPCPVLYFMFTPSPHHSFYFSKCPWMPLFFSLDLLHGCILYNIYFFMKLQIIHPFCWLTRRPFSQTLISYDKGGSWMQVAPPSTDPSIVLDINILRSGDFHTYIYILKT